MFYELLLNDLELSLNSQYVNKRCMTYLHEASNKIRTNIVDKYSSVLMCNTITFMYDTKSDKMVEKISNKKSRKHLICKSRSIMTYIQNYIVHDCILESIKCRNLCKYNDNDICMKKIKKIVRTQEYEKTMTCVTKTCNARSLNYFVYTVVDYNCKQLFSCICENSKIICKYGMKLICDLFL